MKYPIHFELEFKKNPYKGKLIAIEGIDGAGKTTQAKELVKRLNKEGINAAYTKEPTDMVIGQFIREKVLRGDVSMDPIALQYLFNADRVMHMEKIRTLLEKGMVIVTDRYFWSAVAYAMADLDEKPDRYLLAFSVLSAYHQFITPDFNIFLRISPSEAEKRIAQSGKHTEIYDKREKLEKTENTYVQLLEKFPDQFIEINAERPQEEITEEILKTVRARLKMHI